MATKTRLERNLIFRLSQMSAIGESKKAYKNELREAYIQKNGSTVGFNPSKCDGKVFSLGSLKTYRAAIHDFCIWAKNNSIKNEKQISFDVARDYLRDRATNGKSMWTVNRDMSCLNKLYNFGLSKQNCNLPSRRIKDITRSRLPTLSDSRNFSKYENAMFVSQSCGTRRQSICSLTPRNFLRDEKGCCYAVLLIEKGSKERTCPIILQNRERVTEIVNAAETRLNGQTIPIFSEYDRNIDNHGLCRIIYANELLRGIESGEYEQERLPYCLSDRDSQGGDTYRGHDKIAMAQVSFALG